MYHNCFPCPSMVQIEIPGNTISQVVLISSDNPETSSWWERTCSPKWALLLVLCGTGFGTGCFTMTTWCRNGRIRRTLSWWRISLLNKDRDSENKAVWQKVGHSAEPGCLPGTRAGNQPPAGKQQRPGNEISESQGVVGSWVRVAEPARMRTFNYQHQATQQQERTH